ncbi:hypothetical protein M9H77_12376 [Catharanthus roseus]|uniref:Uncharacterized protein n=1 Tax=Catharanthus roseus TaxID=4058 RepID=A0ACC0BHE4_CATRO|nr:hypothetical protein M9H77_12376 [Catharanthus roseus]
MSIRVAHTFYSTSRSYINRGGASFFSDGNQKFSTIVIFFFINLSIYQINTNFAYQYVWSWIINNNDFSLEFSYLIDPLTSIMSILITTIGIMVLIYSDNYMALDQAYLRFFACMTLFSTSIIYWITVISSILNFVSLIAKIAMLLGATLALAQKDIKKGLAYSTMSHYTLIRLDRRGSRFCKLNNFNS